MISGRTTVVGILGFPVEHSFSPAMHNAAFEALGLDWVYVPFKVPPGSLPGVLRTLPGMGLAGFNVTIPHKETVLSLVDELTPAAEAMGAVNTVVNQQGRLIGHNTDGAGLVRSLREAGFDPENKKVLILGAGGAARAAAVSLAGAGVSLVVLANRTPGKAETIIKQLPLLGTCCGKALSLDKGPMAETLQEADLVIQATPVGMWPRVEEVLPFDASLFRPGTWVCDLVYNPDRTRFLIGAEARGCRTVSGRGMLLYQGAEAFELWTGREAPVEVMRRALEKMLQG